MIKTEPGMSRNPPNLSVSMANGSSAETVNDASGSMNRMPHNGYAPQQACRLVDFTVEEKERLTSDLPKFLAPEFVATRAGPGRSLLTYIEGWRIKNLANKLFGFDGWSSAITDVTVDFLDVDPDGKVSVGVSVMVRVTLKDGTFHEDIGYGSSENQRSKASSFEKAKKEATTDGLKRALTSFGNLLGTCLYDKNFVKHLGMQKADKPKFDAKDMYYYPDTRPTHQGQQAPQQPLQQPQHQQNNQNQLQNHHVQRPQQNHQQQAAYGAGTSSNTTSFSEMRPSPYQTNGQKQNANSIQTPSSLPQAISVVPAVGPSNGSTVLTMQPKLATTTIVVDAQNCHSTKQNAGDSMAAAMDDDDMFFGADIEDTRASQPESPRMSDFDNIEMYAMDMMGDDSPIKPKVATPGLGEGAAAGSGQPTLRRSGTFSRSTSSPSVVQTTPTKSAPSAQPFTTAKPPVFAMPTPAGTSSRGSAPVTSQNENPFAAKPASSSAAAVADHTNSSRTPTTVSPQNHGSSHSNNASGSKYLQHQKNSVSKESSVPASVSTHRLGGNQPLSSGTHAAVSGTKNVLRANSLAAAVQASSSSSAASSYNQSNAARGYRAGTTTHSTVQNGLYSNNSAQGTGLKRPLDAHSSVTHKEPRLG